MNCNLALLLRPATQDIRENDAITFSRVTARSRRGESLAVEAEARKASFAAQTPGEPEPAHREECHHRNGAVVAPLDGL